MEKAVTQILGNIERLYDSYEAQSAQMSEQKRQRVGGQIDKKQKQMMESMTQLLESMRTLVTQMDKSPAMRKAELNYSPQLVRECLQDIQGIIKKKNLLFKVNEAVKTLAKNTNQQLKAIKDHLTIANETKFLCCGTDGTAKFKSIMDKFKLSQVQWSLLANLEPKDSVQTFVNPKYSAKDFTFIKEVLKRQWPQDTVKVQYREREVIKQVNTGKPSRLIQANEYLFGINKEPNLAYGLKIYHEQAQNNDAAASAFLGQVYEEGMLLPKDLKKSTLYYKKAMQGKQPFAFYRYAMALIKGELRDKGVNLEDIETGVKLLQKAVSGDHPCPEALIQLGELYSKGSFVVDKEKLYKIPIDLKKAIDYYLKARMMNVPRASNNLGVLYINNKQMVQSNPNSKLSEEANQISNLEKGVKYLEQAQELGFAQAFFNMGHLYESGVLGRKRPQQALMSYYQGGLKGDMQSRLQFAYQIMNQTSIMKQQYEDHYQVARLWLERLVHKIDLIEQNHAISRSMIGTNNHQKAEAVYYLGLMYEYGFGVDRSPKKAFNYYAQSSQMGYAPATNKIGDCYFSGFGVKQDRKLAVGCYANAQKLNNSDAMVNLGTVYLNGIPNLIQRNYNVAYEYFLKANKLQNSNALIHLSYMYKNGLGLPSDIEMAKQLLERSAVDKNPTALYMLKQIGGEYDEKVLFHNLDNDMFATPSKINLKEIVPYISKLKI